MKEFTRRFIIIAGIIVLLGNNLLAQGYRVTVKFKNLKDTVCYMGYDFGNNKYMFDTAKVNQRGIVEFKDTAPLNGGVYLIITPDKKFFEFILVEKEVSLQTDTVDFIGRMKVLKSEENKLFFSYLNFMQQKHVERTGYRLEMNKYKKESDSFKFWVAKIYHLDSVVTSYKNNLKEKYPSTFFVKILKSMDEPQAREKYLFEPDSLYNKYLYSFYQQHFFDNIDFKDARILRTPVYEAKVDKFIDELTFRHPDSVCSSAKRMIDKTLANDTFFKFTLPKIFNKYVPPKYMGDDAIFICLAERYYLSGLATWMDSVNLNKMYKEYLYKISNQIGMKAPNLSMKDSNDHFISLLDIKKPYTLVVFWDPTCGHCRDMIGKLVPWYERHSKDSFAIYSVSNATDRSAWVSYIKEHKMNFINVWDPENVTNYRVLYDAGSLPVIFLIDKNKLIQARRIDVDQLDSMINMLNKQK